MTKNYIKNETSYLAQYLADKMTVEFLKNNCSNKFLAIETLKVIVNEADLPDNGVYYQYENNGMFR